MAYMPLAVGFPAATAIVILGDGAGFHFTDSGETAVASTCWAAAGVEPGNASSRNAMHAPAIILWDIRPSLCMRVNLSPLRVKSLLRGNEQIRGGYLAAVNSLASRISARSVSALWVSRASFRK